MPNAPPAIDAIRRGGADWLREIAAALNEHGVPAPMSRCWSATQARHAFERIPGYEATGRGSCGGPTVASACSGGGPAAEDASARKRHGLRRWGRIALVMAG